MNAKELILEMIDNEEKYRKLNMDAVSRDMEAGLYQSLGMRAGLVNENTYLINKLNVLLQRIEACPCTQVAEEDELLTH